MDSTALITAITGAAYGAMVAYRLARGQWWTATGLAAIGITFVADFVTSGNWSLLEHRIIFIASIALIIFAVAAFGAARRDGERDHEGFLR